jgi:isopentenyl-diphosphate delta-isomerase
MSATECVNEDKIILVDEQDHPIGVAEKMEAHEKNLLHRAFSIFIIRMTDQPEILLQQRALHKYHSGGRWTNTCCSHPRPHETVIEAGMRRLQEEMGITADLRDLGWFQYNAHFENGLSEHEIDHVLIGEVPASCAIIPNPDEVMAYRWITIAALQAELAAQPDQFTPWFEQALEVVIALPLMIRKDNFL